MLYVRLFGRFEARRDSGVVRVQAGSKARELLVFLMLNRQRPHTREMVACKLWGECSVEHSRAYLRKALWQIQTALCPPEDRGCPLLRVDPTWVQVDPEAALWLDVACFEDAYQRTRGTAGRALEADDACRLAEAVSLYGDGLLLDHYEEWCLVERERLRHLELVMLDKLMEYWETRGEYEPALHYGLEILGRDPAREHTHRQVMRLHQLRGDRSGALRQYRTCVRVLDVELGVPPMRETVELCQRIMGGAAPIVLPPALPGGPRAGPPTDPSLQEIMASLGVLHHGLAEVRRQTESIVVALHPRTSPDGDDARAP